MPTEPISAPRIPRDQPLSWGQAVMAMLTIIAFVYGAGYLAVRWWMS